MRPIAFCRADGVGRGEDSEVACEVRLAEGSTVAMRGAITKEVWVEESVASDGNRPQLNLTIGPSRGETQRLIDRFGGREAYSASTREKLYRPWRVCLAAKVFIERCSRFGGFVGPGDDGSTVGEKCDEKAINLQPQ